MMDNPALFFHYMFVATFSNECTALVKRKSILSSESVLAMHR